MHAWGMIPRKDNLFRVGKRRLRATSSFHMRLLTLKGLVPQAPVWEGRSRRGCTQAASGGLLTDEQRGAAPPHHVSAEFDATRHELVADLFPAIAAHRRTPQRPNADARPHAYVPISHHRIRRRDHVHVWKCEPSGRIMWFVSRPVQEKPRGPPAQRRGLRARFGTECRLERAAAVCDCRPCSSACCHETPGLTRTSDAPFAPPPPARCK